jgi:hypothetical protein
MDALSLEFQALAKRLAGSFKSFQRTCIAVRHGMAWEPRYTRLTFSGLSADQYRRKSVETPHLRAHQSVQAITDVREVDAAISNPFELPWPDIKDTYGPTSETRSRFHRLLPPTVTLPSRYPTLEIITPPLIGSGITELVQVELELLAHAEPYESLADLYAEFGVPAERAAPDAPSVVEVILAPVALFSNQSELKDSKLRILVESASDVTTPDLQVGVKAMTRSGVTRFAITGDRFQWLDEGAFLIGEAVHDLPDTPLVLLALSYKGEFLHRWYVKDQSKSYNVRFDLHRAADPDDRFRKTYFDHKNDFEERVALTLTLLDLTVHKYGELVGLTDAPDLLAVSKQGHLFVVECTTGDINSRGKIQRLSERTKALRQLLHGTPAQPQYVVPVIVTSLPRNETAAHWASAENLGVAIIAREEIEALLAQLEAPPTPEVLFARALSMVPTVNIRG